MGPHLLELLFQVPKYDFNTRHIQQNTYYKRAQFRRKPVPPGEFNSSLDKITKTAHGLSKKINEIIWMFSNSNDCLDSLIDYLHQYATDIFEPVNINCFISLPEKIPNIKIDANARQMIVLTFKEILNNILRHSYAKEVHISVKLYNNTLTINVNDNGIGFDPNLLINSTGHGLSNIRDRISKIKGACEIQTNSAGTSITISASI